MLGLGKNGNTASMGLLELRLGRNGAGMAIGSGGVDASLGNIASAIRGIGESYSISKKKYGSELDQLNLNVSNALGWTKNEKDWKLGRELFEGSVGFEVGNLSKGLATTQDGRIVLDSRLFGGTDKERSAEIAMIIAHESEHLGGGSEADAYLRQLMGFNDLREAWGVTGTGSISGIGGASTYLGEYGTTATLTLLGSLGLLDSTDGNQYVQGILNPETQRKIHEKYGYISSEVELKRIYESELVRQMYGDKHPIWANEMEGFFMGESLRLGKTASLYEQELNSLQKLILDTKSIEQALLAKADAYREYMKKELGIDPEKSYKGLDALSDAVSITLSELGPIYMEYFLGESIGKLAENVGVQLPYGMKSGLSSLALGNEDTLKKLGQGFMEDAIEDAIKKNYKGPQADKVSGALGLLKTAIEAAFASYALIKKINDGYDGYINAVEMAENTRAGFGVAKQNLAKNAARGMLIYETAAAFMGGMTGRDPNSAWGIAGQANTNSYFHNMLMNEAKAGYLYRQSPETLVNAFYNPSGYQGLLISGLSTMLSMTSHENITKYFNASVGYDNNTGRLAVQQQFNPYDYFGNAVSYSTTRHWEPYIKLFANTNLPSSRYVW